MNKLCLFVFALFALTSVQAAEAGPMLKLSPSSGSYDNGSTFKITVAVDSGTAKSMAVDAFLTFDAAKLEVVSIDAPTTPAFANSMGKNIYNTDGKFDMSFNPSGDAVLSDSVAIKGDLAIVTFKAKATGTADVKFTCVAGSTIDTNIFDTTGNDVIDCTSNQNGSYTINASSSGTTASTPTPTTVVQNVTTAPGELPRTGGFESTLGLMIFGLVGAMAGVALKWL
ncbi:MAG: cohesin domain-containing protein [Candidatus Shapirobacteria bacterium]